MLEERLAPAMLQWLGVTNDWDDTGNWSGGQLPGPLDDVIFSNASQVAVANINVDDLGVQVHDLKLNPGFTLTVSGTLSIDQFHLWGGAVNGNGYLSINENFDFSSGVMAGSGETYLQANATANFPTTATAPESTHRAPRRGLGTQGQPAPQRPWSVCRQHGTSDWDKRRNAD